MSDHFADARFRLSGYKACSDDLVGISPPKGTLGPEQFLVFMTAHIPGPRAERGEFNQVGFQRKSGLFCGL